MSYILLTKLVKILKLVTGDPRGFRKGIDACPERKRERAGGDKEKDS